MFSNIVIDSSSTRVDSSVIDETRVGTLTTRGSTSYYSVSYGATPWTPHHDIVHEGVVEQHISGQYCK